MRVFVLMIFGLVLLGSTMGLRAEEDAESPELATWAVGRWETADANGSPWLWLEIHADGRYRLGAVERWLDAKYRVEAKSLFMQVTAGEKGPQEEVEAGVIVKGRTLGLGPPGASPTKTYTRVGPPGEPGSLVGLWTRHSREGPWFMRITQAGTMHGRVPQEASEGRIQAKGSTLLLQALSEAPSHQAVRIQRDGSDIVMGEGDAAVRLRRLDVPWYDVPGAEPPPLPVGSWMHVKDGELQGWTFVFDQDGRHSFGVAHQEGFSGIRGRWRWEDDVVALYEAPRPGVEAPSAAETLRLRVRPLAANAMEVFWLEPLGQPGEKGWRYERTTCPAPLIRVWEGSANGTTYVLDLEAHHVFELETANAETDEKVTKRGEWHVWRDQLWLTFPEEEDFAQWRFEQPKPDELLVKPARGGAVTFRVRAP